MSLYFTFVAGDVALLGWGLLCIINVGECHSIGNRRPPSEAVLLLPVCDNVVRSDDGHRVVVPALEKVVHKVLDELPVASPIAAEEECNGSGAGKCL